MSTSVRFGEHIRRNAVAYVALFVALSGTSYAASKITSKDIKKNAITSKLVKDGQIATADLADLAVTEQKLAFEAATQAELNAFLDELASGGTINDPSNPMQWTRLRGVPGGFADGTDDTGGAPGNNSLAQAEPGVAAEDEIRDGAIDSEDLTNGTIANADVATAAAIDDAKLGTIDDPGKVADAALSSNVALLNQSQTFTAGKTFSGAITTALDASAPAIGTALDIGANDIKTSGATISSTELNTLDGNVANPGRSVSLPLGSFVNVTDETTLNFTPSDGISPDLALLGDSLVIEWDDNSSGVADTDFVASNFSVPIDFASGGGITVVSSKDGDTGVDERLRCETSVNGAAALSAMTTTFMSTSQTIHIGGMGSPVGAGDRVTVRCGIDDGAGGSTANDVVRIREVRFGYQSDQ